MSSDPRQKGAQVPSTVEAAEAAHDAARAAHADNLVNETATRAHADDLRQRLVAGNGADVVPSDITEADAHAEHAALMAQGSAQSLTDLGKAVLAARAAEECDRIVSTLPVLGSQVLAALEDVETALAVFAQAANNYDTFVEHAHHRVNTTGIENPRVKLQRMGDPTVDQLTLTKCRGASHLASAVLPAMVSVDAPVFATTELKILAEGAITLPTV